MPNVLPKRRLPMRLWELLHEPRAVTALVMTSYLIVFIVGLSALTSPPLSIASELGWVTRLWATSLLAGGAIGLIAAPRGIWWLERTALIATGTGAIIYLATILQLHFIQDGNRIPQAGFVALAVIACATRWARIRWSSLDPTK